MPDIVVKSLADARHIARKAGYRLTNENGESLLDSAAPAKSEGPSQEARELSAVLELGKQVASLAKQMEATLAAFQRAVDAMTTAAARPLPAPKVTVEAPSPSMPAAPRAPGGFVIDVAERDHDGHALRYVLKPSKE